MAPSAVPIILPHQEEPDQDFGLPAKQSAEVSAPATSNFAAEVVPFSSIDTKICDVNSDEYLQRCYE